MVKARRPAEAGGRAHRDLAPAVVAQELRTVAYPVDGPRDLHARVRQRLAALARGLQGQALGALAHQIGSALQDDDTFMGRQPGVAIPKQRVRDGQGAIDPGPIHDIHGGDWPQVEGIHDLQTADRRDRLGDAV